MMPSRSTLNHPNGLLVVVQIFLAFASEQLHNGDMICVMAQNIVGRGQRSDSMGSVI